MTILVTGAAGFIGFHVAAALLARGDTVLGLDDLNPYYDVRLKSARLERLEQQPGFAFRHLDIADREALEAVWTAHPGIDRVVHLAAQAGVRYSLDNPRAYLRSNLAGHLEMLELARARPGLRHFVYASSSSVYGFAEHQPSGLDDRADTPRSLYAATKRANELMSVAYSHLYGIPATGLRFFTVYGPWGRPDMAPMIFAQAILDGTPIRLFNGGELERDFTFVDDIVAGVLAALDRPPEADAATQTPPHRLFNLGHGTPVPLRRFIAALEAACGRTAILEHAPMQPGDVYATAADIDDSSRLLGYRPQTAIEDGIPRFVEWFKAWRLAG